MNFLATFRFAVLSTSLCLAASSSFANQVTTVPASYAFKGTYVGLVATTVAFTLTNANTKSIKVNSVSFTCPEYKLASGVTPITIQANGGITHYSVYFAPDLAQAFNCNMVLAFDDGTSNNVAIQGTGLKSSAVAALDNTSFIFPSTTVGTTTTTKTVNIQNTGTTKMNLIAINIKPPNFVASGTALPVLIQAGQRVAVNVTYSPTAAHADTGVMTFVYDSVPANGVSMTGVGVASVPVAIANLTALPTATQSSAYQASLTTSGGTSPFTFVLASGSTLPSGLSLSSTGLISGTLSGSVGTGTYSFTIKVTDARSGTSSKAFTLAVAAKTGAACNTIFFDVPSTSTPLTALNDLATGTYQGSEGGLYPNGSDVRPAQTDADAVTFGSQITALNSNGLPDPNGVYVLLGVGESTALDEFGQFVSLANADPSKNKKLVIVNGAQGGATPFQLTSTTSAYWNTILNNYLVNSNVTAKQVVAAWIEDTDGIASGMFPSDVTTLQSEYETVARDLHTLFPNLTIAYFSSRFYAGYSNGISTVNPEPYAYEVSFAVKWAIQDQINGVNNLNYKSSNGTVVAPLMIWGPYYWSNGLLGRRDGLVWTCQDLSKDGTHPSNPIGQQKVANQLLEYFKSDTSTTPWFLQH